MHETPEVIRPRKFWKNVHRSFQNTYFPTRAWCHTGYWLDGRIDPRPGAVSAELSLLSPQVLKLTRESTCSKTRTPGWLLLAVSSLTLRASTIRSFNKPSHFGLFYVKRFTWLYFSHCFVLLQTPTRQIDVVPLLLPLKCLLLALFRM